jgi:SAM-dependent methyltransferase
MPTLPSGRGFEGGPLGRKPLFEGVAKDDGDFASFLGGCGDYGATSRLWILSMLEETDQTILDLGCGPAFLSELLRDLPWKPRYVGLDDSASMLERASARNRSLVRMSADSALEASGNAVVLGDARKRVFPEGSFDCVVVRHVLEHLEDPETLIAEACRVARKKILVVWSKPTSLLLKTGKPRVSRLWKNIPTFHHDRIEMSKRFESSGWRFRVGQRINANTEYEEDGWLWMRRVIA